MTRQVTPFHFIGSRKERAAGEQQGREGRAEEAEHAVQGFVGKQEEDGEKQLGLGRRKEGKG